MAAKDEETKPKVEEKQEEEKKDQEAKEQKTEDVEMKEEKIEDKKEEPKEPEETETDAPADSRAKAKKVELNFEDSTLNVMPTAGGRLLQTLSEGGMQFLLASVRANVGLKAGRYMFEARIVENLCNSMATSQAGGQGDSHVPKALVRLGFSTAGSSLFMGDGPNNCCFDSEGFFLNDKTRKKNGQKFIQNYTAAVLLNLDPASPNANTVSLFINGTRASQPQPLPEALVGKALFPTITYKNVSLEVNFGPSSRAPLPFACRMVGDAAAADTEATTLIPSKGKKVVFPVGLPEQGYFDWVDEFCEKNPGFVELSDRKIIEWALKSGVWRPRSQGSGSNDKPEAKLGVPSLDDWSVRKIIAAVAPVLSRSYVVPELKSNLISGDREKALKRFMANDFERKAVVIVGEPSAASKQRVQALLLAEKKDKVQAEKKKKAQEEERKRLLELKRAKAEEAKKMKAAAQRKKEGKEEEDAPVEAKEEEKKEEDVKMEEPEEEPELTEEEKKLWYRKQALPDITEAALAKSYASFTLPTKDEGFDTISYDWQSEQDCATVMKSWILEKKLTQRAEDLTPGADFKEKWTAWQKTLQEWRRRQSEFKDPSKRKALQAKKVEAAKKAIEEEKKTLLEAGSEEAAKELEEKAIKSAEPKEIDMEELDVLAVEDVMDVGNGEPLFFNFAYEDWTLLSLRYELHLLLHSFKKDLNDPDRLSFGEKHFAYYYNKYFKKSWNLQIFNVKKVEEIFECIKDTVTASSSGFFKAEQAEDTAIETFVKLTEDHRRERERRVDAGDETAKLKFNKPAPPASRPAEKGGSGKGGGYGNSKGGGNSYGSSSQGTQKRPYSSYSPAPTSYSNKQPRTGYSSAGYGSGGYGGGSYSGGGYRR